MDQINDEFPYLFDAIDLRHYYYMRVFNTKAEESKSEEK